MAANDPASIVGAHADNPIKAAGAFITDSRCMSGWHLPALQMIEGLKFALEHDGRPGFRGTLASHLKSRLVSEVCHSDFTLAGLGGGIEIRPD